MTRGSVVSIPMGPSDHPAAFYVGQADGSFRPTQAARGPWSDDHQHGGPPSALLLRAVERFGDDAEQFAVVRLSVELLRPVPLDAALVVELEPRKLGGQAQRFVARLRIVGGEVVAEATVLRLRMADVELPEARHQAPAPLPPPDQGEPFVFPFFRCDVGYHTAVELRIARGPWGQGSSAAWMRPRVPLVEGEPLTPLQAVAIAADAANGIAMVLDSSRYAFVNPDMTIAMARPPRGLWVGLDAHGIAGAIGVGLNDCRLFDESGELGRVLQSLVIRPHRAGC